MSIETASSTSFSRTPGRRLALSTLNKNAETTLFFLHGLGGNRRQWRLQWEYFSQQNVNLVAWDCLAHGESARSKHQKAFDSQLSVQDLAAIINAFSTTKNIVIAHSFGCRLVIEWLTGLLETGSALPIDGLILLAPASLAPSLKGPLFGNWLDRLPFWAVSLGKPLLQRRFETLAWHQDTNPDLLRTERRATQRNSLFMINAVRNGARAITPEHLKNMRLPVHILAGKQDGIVPATEIQKLQALLPESRLEFLPACGHQIMLEKPADTNSLIEQEIRRISSSDGEPS